MGLSAGLESALLFSPFLLIPPGRIHIRRAADVSSTIGMRCDESGPPSTTPVTSAFCPAHLWGVRIGREG